MRQSGAAAPDVNFFLKRKNATAGTERASARVSERSSKRRELSLSFVKK
jgi:hypothetical protein